jgi:hypothetical protein
MESFGWRPDTYRPDPWQYELDITAALEWLATLLVTVAEAAGARLAPLDDPPGGRSAAILSLGPDQRWRGGQRARSPIRMPA